MGGSGWGWNHLALEALGLGQPVIFLQPAAASAGTGCRVRAGGPGLTRLEADDNGAFFGHAYLRNFSGMTGLQFGG